MSERMQQILRAISLAALIEETSEAAYSTADLLDDLATVGLRLDFAPGIEMTEAYLEYLTLHISGITDQDLIHQHTATIGGQQ